MNAKATISVLLALFMAVHAGAQDYHCLNLRGDLKNSFKAMAVDKKATVAFLGGSITEMEGWKDMVREDLRRRFPDTEFNFINAGISSLGSTPHAFRFQRDVLAHGTPDLLFVEAAVNDHTNEFGAREQVLAMEGIFRHALAANPFMDIVLLDFIYEPFIPLLAAGETPDVIINHESVAAHYGMTSANMAQEVSDRMQAGVLTWDEFGGTHPAPAGHRIYADAIAAVLDSCWIAGVLPTDGFEPVAHPVPEPMDEFCYENGAMVPAASVKGGRSSGKGGIASDGGRLVLRKVSGFKAVECWHPADSVSTRPGYVDAPMRKVGTRPGFVDVPMLSTDCGGSFTLKFRGTAVGLFAVCGPDCGTIEYSVDGGDFQQVNTFTKWSRGLYLPWVWMLAEDLPRGRHSVTVRIPAENGCHIRDFVINR